MQVLHSSFKRKDVVDEEKVDLRLIIEDKDLKEENSGDYHSDYRYDKGKVRLHTCHDLMRQDKTLDDSSLLILHKVLLIVGSDSCSPIQDLNETAVDRNLR